MDDTTTLAPPAIDAAFLDRFLRGEVNEHDTRMLINGDREIAAFTILAIQQRVASQRQAAGPNTPPGSVPAYEMPSPRPSKSKRKRGGQKGHAGRRRPAPTQPDRVRGQQLDHCPDRGGELKRTGDTHERLSEDIPEGLKPMITKDVIHRDWCPRCRKRVEPKPPDVLPRCSLGNRTLVLSALLHFHQGLTLSQIVDTFNFHLRLKITPGGLIQMWHRLADILFAWYEAIHDQSLAGSKLHADETGWRVGGETHWRWCFATDDLCYYMIDRSRGSPALKKFFTRHFDGTLITDFWSPYDAIACADQQKCWPHLLRDAATVDQRHGDDPEWKSFARRLTSVYRAARKLHCQRARLAEADYDMATVRLEGRLAKMAVEDWRHPGACRLAKRLATYGNQLVTFLWYDEVPSDNNAGERAIRPAVMIRKNSYANQSDRSAMTQSIQMSIIRTLRLRNQQPLDAILTALAE